MDNRCIECYRNTVEDRSLSTPTTIYKCYLTEQFSIRLLIELLLRGTGQLYLRGQTDLHEHQILVRCRRCNSTIMYFTKNMLKRGRVEI